MRRGTTIDRARVLRREEAIRARIDLNEWQIAGIQQALKEADADDFASEKEVRVVTGKRKRGAR